MMNEEHGAFRRYTGQAVRARAIQRRSAAQSLIMHSAPNLPCDSDNEGEVELIAP